MSSRMVALVVLVELLGGLSSIPGTSSTDTKADGSDQNLMMTPVAESSSFYDYYMIPSDVSATQFGGDRSDEFLYPPDSYYKQWAEEEQEKEDMANNS